MSDATKERAALLVSEVLLTAVLVLSVATDDPYPAFSSVLGMGMTAIPWALRRYDILALPWEMTVIAGAVTFLHAFGILFSLYDLVWWWDVMTHMLASMVIASVMGVGILLVESRYPPLRLSSRSVLALVIGSVILSGVIWEVLEFSFDGLLGMHMQYSLDDTATDLSFDILGGAIVALMVPFYLPRLREGVAYGKAGRRARCRS